MIRLRRIAGTALALAVPVASLAQAPDSTVTSADSTQAERAFLSTDGSISVFEEAKPGEGLDGFWWEYDADADLARLLDDDAREVELESLRDAFGFEIVVPESIRALRDSVYAVADSIRADRIDLKTRFDPKLKSTYNQTKDNYSLLNNFEANLPMTHRGSVNAKTSSDLSYNEATDRSVDNREVASTFTYRFQPDLTGTASITRTDDIQERGGVRDSDRDNTALNTTLRANRTVRGVKVEGTAGFTMTGQNYTTSSTDGKSAEFRPTWGTKMSRPYTNGRVSFTYNGNLGRSSREERLSVATDSLDENLQPIVEIRETKQSEENYNHALGTTLDYDFSADYDMVVNGKFSRSQFQFISQEAAFLGQQETRVQGNRSIGATLNAKPFDGFTLKATGDLGRNESLYDLNTVRTRITTTASTNVDINYTPWSGGDFLVKMERKHEDRNLTTIQAGIVDGYKFSGDYKQDITANVSFAATYFLTLDRFAFDDPDSNTGDRDLLTKRSTFVVRYNPQPDLRMDVKMEVRENQSINIHRTKSGGNKTDFNYLITPTYSWKRGQASFSGEFTADVRYAVFDFREDDNSLIRRFSSRQRWRHSFSDRLSTSLLWTYEFNDQGGYRPSPVDGRRKYSKASELFRRRVETEVLYKPRRFLETNVRYRWDGDDTYRIAGDERTFSGSRRTQEITYGITLRRQIMKHVRTNLRFSHTLKNGDTVGAFDRNFYTVRATVEYQPLKKKQEEGAAQ